MPELAPVLPPPKGRPKRAAAYLQALQMQAELLAIVRNPRTRAADKAQCVRAWDVLEDRKRILRNRPLPGQLRPDLAKPNPRRLPAFRSVDAIDVTTDRKESLLPTQTVPAPDPTRERQLFSDEVRVPRSPSQATDQEDTSAKTVDQLIEQVREAEKSVTEDQ